MPKEADQVEAPTRPLDTGRCSCGARGSLYTLLTVGYAFTGVVESEPMCGPCATSLARRGNVDPPQKRVGRPKRVPSATGSGAEAPGEPGANPDNGAADPDDPSVSENT